MISFHYGKLSIFLAFIRRETILTKFLYMVVFWKTFIIWKVILNSETNQLFMYRIIGRVLKRRIQCVKTKSKFFFLCVLQLLHWFLMIIDSKSPPAINLIHFITSRIIKEEHYNLRFLCASLFLWRVGVFYTVVLTCILFVIYLFAVFTPWRVGVSSCLCVTPV